MFRVASLGLAIALTLVGCSKKGSPEQVADAFAEAYFLRVDQEKAKEYTALGATQMLEAELRSVEALRKDGYTPSEATTGRMTLHRGEPTMRDQRMRFPFEVVIHQPEGSDTIRDADIELTQIQGAWKVVRVGLTSRP